jgi:SAM-dependent methyltransferase
MTITNEIHTCEVCGNAKLEPVLDLGKHPLCDDLVAVGDKRTCPEFQIEILYCANCGTAHQRFQVPKQELFPTSYHYRSRFTADVLDGMFALVNACEQRLGSLQGKLVLDVGCNDGSLLDFFQKKGAKTLGIEPTDAYRDGLEKGHELINGFFSPQTAAEFRRHHGSPDVITFTNVFAHIENLPEAIEALKILMSSNTMLVVENHYLGAVLDRHQFDTFYHEHPRTYSLKSFHHIAKSLGVGLSGVEFPSRYGGNIRVFMGGPNLNSSDGATSVASVLETESHYGERLLIMQGEVEQWKTRVSALILDLVSKHGKLPGKAFPGRAAILVKLLGLDNNSISAVYEKPGSMKIGHYIPGTRIPILSDDDFFAQTSQPTVILNLAWHISAEINKYLQERGYEGQVVDILEASEFTHRAIR